jgi:hypothetical protein
MEADCIDRQQQQIEEESPDISRERAIGDEEYTADHVRDAQRHYCTHQQGSDKKDGADQSEHIGKRDVGQQNFQQPVEQCVVSDVVRIETNLDQNLCDPEIVRRRIKNAVKYRRKICTD